MAMASPSPSPSRWEGGDGPPPIDFVPLPAYNSSGPEFTIISHRQVAFYQFKKPFSERQIIF